MTGNTMIKEWDKSNRQEVIDLILSIQREEFNIAITAADQPDLHDVAAFYQHGNGNFWIAVDDDRVTGTIALMDVGNKQVALRKMFVHPVYRGKEKAVAQQLLDKVFGWCRLKQVENIYLGTIHIFKAAQRFYERNGFHQVTKQQLPTGFPVMAVDDVFYCYQFSR
jgi:N-acetylglutamate synthase-like GNAT family acetyltransferase